MANAIEVDGLTKRYRGRRGRSTIAVDGLSLAVPEGGVFGFMGPNGSGKTTTIRCLLGLARPSSGHVDVLGAPVPDRFAQVARHVGAVVESAPSFPTMTAREQLRLLAKLIGLPSTRVDDVLERVGIASRAGDLVKRYSLGMRQRLALAAALLKDPSLLVLDEPANGLDPAGMRQLRELLRNLASEGRTVFVSSHLLAELEQICDAVAIVDHGRVVAAGAVSEILAGVERRVVSVGVDDASRARSILEQIGLRVEPARAGLRVHGADPQDVAAALGRAGMWVSALEVEVPTLESRFLELTGDRPVEVGA